MKKMSRLQFLKEMGRWGVLTGVVGIGAVFGSRDQKFSCTNLCAQCTQFEHGKCGIGLK